MNEKREKLGRGLVKKGGRGKEGREKDKKSGVKHKSRTDWLEAEQIEGREGDREQKDNRREGNSGRKKQQHTHTHTHTHTHRKGCQ